MEFIYRNAILPTAPEFHEKLEKAASELEQKISKLDYKNLPISDYSKRYFGDYLRKLRYSLQACSFIISWSVAKSGKKPEEITFIDNGGGVGILSFLAKEAGIKTVVYNDIYDVATKDAAIIAEALNIPVDHFAVGDVEELLLFVKNKNLKCDVVASRNVIEHIYDLDSYFKKISTITTGPLVLFFATTANIKNPLVNIYTKRIQKKAELEGKKPHWGQKQRDAILPYLLIRKKILQENFAHLDASIVKELSVRTRGMAQSDILKTAENYIKTNNLPAPPLHPTNTCDPYTGNWAEHLVPAKDYEKLFEKNGFQFEVINGFYNTNYKLKALNLITPLINVIIKNLGSKSLALSPFIGLAGKRK